LNVLYIWGLKLSIQIFDTFEEMKEKKEIERNENMKNNHKETVEREYAHE